MKIIQGMNKSISIFSAHFLFYVTTVVLFCTLCSLFSSWLLFKSSIFLIYIYGMSASLFRFFNWLHDLQCFVHCIKGHISGDTIVLFIACLL